MEQIYKLIKDDLKKVENESLNILKCDNLILKDISAFFNGHSKRIRSLLAILYINAQNRELNDDLIKLLCAGELVHNASLLHDDVIDYADTRRGKITIAKLHSPQISVLAGDLLISKAIQIIFNLDNKKITDYFLNCTEQMCNAEILQQTYKGIIPDIDTYLKICSGKTASLFEAILMSSATILKLDASIAKKIANIFGTVFQIRNDINPISRDEDIKNNIHTIYDIFGIEKTEILIDNYKEEMRSIIKDFPKNLYSEGLESLINIL